MKRGPDSIYGPTIGAIKEAYHAVWLNWQMDKRQTWLNVVPEHSGCRRAGGLCSGTFDLTDMRIKRETWLNVLPRHSGNQRGLPCGHVSLNWHLITYSKGRRERNELSIHLSVPSSVPSSIHGWHHINILYNVKPEKLL
jgi:hypothetical protein